MDKKLSATMTVDEAHAEIGKDKISRAGFYAALRRNEIPNIRLGRRILVPRNSLSKFLENAGQVIA
jgi:excisionase family DNA binding protein